MDRRVRYEALQTEEDNPTQLEEQQPPAVLAQTNMVQIPIEEDYTQPPAEEPPASSNVSQKNGPFSLPSYNVATSLPSYEEAERTKESDMQHMQEQQQETSPIRDVDRFPEMLLGTDGMFLCMFLISFVFNWVGLLAAICINHTVAGRLGAISGFGLSMVKWVLIVKHNHWVAHMGDNESWWLWWLLIILGFLLFFRGCTQYIRVKYQWQHLPSNLRNRAYLMF